MELGLRGRLQFSQCTQSQPTQQQHGGGGGGLFGSQVQPTPSTLLADRLGSVSLSSQQQFAVPSQMDSRSQQQPGRPQALQVPGEDEYASQMEYLGTQDFITPADQQTDLQYDPAADAAHRLRSPAQLSPKLKRPRKLCSGDENEPPCASQDWPTASQAAAAAGACDPAGGGSMRPPQGPFPKGRGGPRVVRVQSPPCHRNVFLGQTGDGDDEGSGALLLKNGGRALPRGPPPSSRFRADFKELGVLGSGNFSRVFRCAHRLDGTEYAIKRSAKPVAGTAQRQQWVQEAQALAAVGAHPHIVRYYGAWAEPLPEGGCEHFYLQLEQCGEPLGTRLAVREPFKERELIAVLRQMGSALAHMHARGMAHMDVKPDNIYAALDDAGMGTGMGGGAGSRSPSCSPPDVAMADDTCSGSGGGSGFGSGGGGGGASTSSSGGGGGGGYGRVGPCYKLGDFGLATPLAAQRQQQQQQGEGGAQPAATSSSAAAIGAVLEEGDARYVAGEVLAGRAERLEPADVFALGATVYELASGTQLPTGGQAYQDLRQGKLKLLPTFSGQLQKLLKQMMAPNPADRPTAAKLLQHPLLQQAAPARVPKQQQQPTAMAPATATVAPAAAAMATAAAAPAAASAPMQPQQQQQKPSSSYGMLNFTTRS